MRDTARAGHVSSSSLRSAAWATAAQPAAASSLPGTRHATPREPRRTFFTRWLYCQAVSGYSWRQGASTRLAGEGRGGWAAISAQSRTAGTGRGLQALPTGRLIQPHGKPLQTGQPQVQQGSRPVAAAARQPRPTPPSVPVALLHDWQVEVGEHAVALVGGQAENGLPDDLQRQQAELLLQVDCAGRRGAGRRSGQRNVRGPG